MKATAIKTGAVAALTLLMTISGGCKKTEMDTATNNTSEKSSTDPRNEMIATRGMAAIRITATPDRNFGAVNVEVTGVSILYGDGNSIITRWINLPVKPKIYDLLQYQDGLTAILADYTHLPYGGISRVRLTLGTHNTIVTGDANGRYVYPLQLSGADENASVHVEANVNMRSKLWITLNFNTAASINFESKGVYILKPVINLKSVLYEPMIPNE